MPLRSVLIVDDSPGDTFLTQVMIEEVGFAKAVYSSKNGREALTFLDSEPTPDVIFLDVNMPRMSGHAFLAHCKANGLLDPRTAVVMLTGSDEPEDRAKAEASAQVFDFRVKPVSVDYLQGLADRLAQRPARRDSAP